LNTKRGSTIRRRCDHRWNGWNQRSRNFGTLLLPTNSVRT